MGRKRKKRQPGCFVFSPEMVTLLQEAMKLFAQALTRAEDQSEKVAFAREMMQQINGKLDAMSISVGATCLMSFDANEKVVIATAIQLYLFDVVAVPEHSQRAKEFERCQHLLRFAHDPGREPRL
ncbi:MAG TPA: hypothetical protein VFV38_48745 [Ktedonobacteraceae bacterium]|nr:hypothetical protein [Ktedonobacteraceae bacterium]